MFRAEKTREERYPKVSQRKEYVNCLKVITLKTNKRRVIIIAKEQQEQRQQEYSINSLLRPDHRGGAETEQEKGV